MSTPEHVAGHTRQPLARRTVLATGAAAGAGLAVASTSAPGGADTADRRRRRVFAHGVASGDPQPRAVVIWTRVTPTRAATPGSGNGPRVTVRWELARDRRFTRVVRRGSFTTSASRDHTVKVDVRRLRPGTRYFYRFRWDGVTSPIGRTRTAPRPLATPRRLRFGIVSCANLQAGWFTAYRHLAKRNDLDAVIHLGDYLYEYAPGEYGYGQSNVDVRPHDPPREMVTLEDYRRRHAQYKRDRDLQKLHRRNAFIVTWDDHEVTNDQWREGAENHDAGEGDYLQRRARAHRAYDEWMPVRLDGTAALGDGTRLYRRLRFGRLAELSMLDLRTYRDRQVDTAAPSPVPTPAEQASDPERTVTGRRQLDWLKAALRNNRGVQWKLVGNPVMIAPVTFADLPHEAVDPVNDVTGLLPRDGFPYNVDQWDGYTDDRREIFEHVLDNGVKDVVFLTGDIHSGWACDLPLDHATYPLGDTAGVEFVCTSVTSNNLKDITGDSSGATSTAVETTIKANNRHVRYLDFDSHGFSVLDVTPARAQMDWFVVGDRQDRDAGVRHAVSWATGSGTNRVHPVDNPVGARHV